ncbi:MAG: quinolinate synthase NadA [Pirellulales bacterium]|nr:quinolinate synthase NadA [Pirellulales bacterium]
MPDDFPAYTSPPVRHASDSSTARAPVQLAHTGLTSPAETGASDPEDLCLEVEDLLKSRDATLLAHYYQNGEIQELAHITGDSLQLARAAMEVSTSTIVFCGVHFMAETAKMLNPEKRVLLPDLLAGCSLAESCPAPALAEFQVQLRTQGVRFETVTYVNSSAGVKAISDWVVTSGNAEEVIRRIDQDVEILFVPDRHLGSYLQDVTGRKMILWNGACEVHEIFSVGDLLKLKRRLPEAVTIAHPECPANIREHSDYVGGTRGMLKHVEKYRDPMDFLVATEANMLWQLQNATPRHRYHPVPGVTCACNKCPHMAQNTLVKLRDCLRDGTPEIHWQESFTQARKVVIRSFTS